MRTIMLLSVSLITVIGLGDLVHAQNNITPQPDNLAGESDSTSTGANTNTEDSDLTIDQNSFQQGTNNSSGFYNNFGDEDRFQLSPTGCWTERETFQASGAGETNPGNSGQNAKIRVTYRNATTDQGKICKELQKIKNQGEQEIKEIEKKIQEVKASVKNYETCVVDSETPEPTCREAFLDK